MGVYFLLLKNLFYFTANHSLCVLLSYFRINDPYRLLGLLLLMALLYLPGFIDLSPLTYPELKNFIWGERVREGYLPYTGIVDSVAPLNAWFQGLMDMVFGRSLLARHIVAFVLVFLQSAFFGVLLIDKKVFTENTYIPSLLFSLLFLFSFDTLSLTGELLGSGVLLFALNKLYKELEFRQQLDETIFKLGLFISIASLFSFSFFIFFPGAIILLILFTRSTLRTYLLLTTGFLLPHGLLISVYFLMDATSAIWEYYYLPGFGFYNSMLVGGKSIIVLAVVPLTFLLFSFIVLNRESRLTKYQSQLVQLMFLWTLFGFIHAFFTDDFRPQSFIPLIPGFSFFITHLFLTIRRKRFLLIGFWVFFIGMTAPYFLIKYKIVDLVAYDQLWINTPTIKEKNKRVLILGDEIEGYLENRLSTPFLNWGLSSPIFKEADRYENIITINKYFEHDAPEVIIDSEGVMPNVLERIPLLKKKYKRTPEGNYVLINN